MESLFRYGVPLSNATVNGYREALVQHGIDPKNIHEITHDAGLMDLNALKGGDILRFHASLPVD